MLGKSFLLLLFNLFFCNGLLTAQTKVFSYVPLGDSYTIGEGLKEEDRFPNQLAKMLLTDGITLSIKANPAQSGWTTADLIANELPKFKEIKPQFATLLIGVNDWVQNVDEETFTKNFNFILAEMIKVLPSKTHLIVLTIPDFSATPKGIRYGNGRNISQGIAKFNSIIKQSCDKQKITVVDIFETSKDMRNHKELISGDGLHPSGLEYGIWAKMTREQVKKLLTEKH